MDTLARPYLKRQKVKEKKKKRAGGRAQWQSNPLSSKPNPRFNPLTLVLQTQNGRVVGPAFWKTCSAAFPWEEPSGAQILTHANSPHASHKRKSRRRQARITEDKEEEPGLRVQGQTSLHSENRSYKTRNQKHPGRDRTQGSVDIGVWEAEQATVGIPRDGFVSY